MKGLENVVVNADDIRKPSSIIFCVNEYDWIIKITEEGIKFNKDGYPEVTADGFAQAFVEILEKNYDVKFVRKIQK